MKKTALLAIPFAATIALTGCGSMGSPATTPAATTVAASPSAEAAAPSTEAAATTPAPTTAVAPSANADTTPSATADTTPTTAATIPAPATPVPGSGQFTDAQLSSVMDYVKSSFPSTTAVVLDSTQIKAALPMTMKLAESMDVEPASCGALASSSSLPDTLDSLTMAAISWPGEDLGSSNSVGINSFPSAAAAENAAMENKNAVNACPTFTMNMAGIKADVTTKPNDAYKGNPGFVDAWVKNVDMQGITVTTATVTYLEGNNVVTTSVSGSAADTKLLTDAEMMAATALGAVKENS